jgi:hypothetical protein
MGEQYRCLSCPTAFFAKHSSICEHSPLEHHPRQRVYTELHGPNYTGTSRLGHPVLNTCHIAVTIRLPSFGFHPPFLPDPPSPGSA